ncbi:MAG: Crp/Fnr family transcriptional regulator [Acutalibacteraceae bacterium]
MDKKYLDILNRCSLFDGTDKNNLAFMLNCLEADIKCFSKGETVFSQGSKAGLVGIILSGCAQIVTDDYYGNRNLLASVGEGELFAEAYACADVTALPVSVIAVSECKILLFNCKKIINSNRNSCKFHYQIINNLLKIVSQKNIALNEKAQITSKRTTKEKIMAYLSAYAKKCGSSEFDIPLNRQELADYLCVERSAMSAEIGKLKKEGKIFCQKNHFKLLEDI